MKKCEFCAKEISYHEQYCSIDCHAQANKYYEKCEKFGKLFSVINGMCVFGIPVGLFVSTFLRLPGTILALLSCVILGVMLILLPFPTDTMIKKHKLQKAMKITKIFGMVIIGFGIILSVLMLFVIKF